MSWERFNRLIEVSNEFNNLLRNTKGLLNVFFHEVKMPSVHLSEYAFREAFADEGWEERSLDDPNYHYLRALVATVNGVRFSCVIDREEREEEK